MSAESFGMMSDAYFKGRAELVQWVNALLDLNIKKVEECAPGAIYCQIVDSIFQGKIALKQVDFSYRYEHEYMRNYRVLQNAFKKLGLEKVIPVERLVKGRHQDNLEFLQWMYMWYRNCVGSDEIVEYDGKARRLEAKNAKNYTGAGGGATRGSARAATRKPAGVKTTTPRVGRRVAPAASRAGGASATTKASARTGAAATRTAASTKTASRGAAKSNRARATKTRTAAKVAGGAAVGAAAGAAAVAVATGPDPAMVKELETAKQEKADLEKEFEELTAVAKALESERDFYFNKILTVETVVKEKEESLPASDPNKPFLEEILRVLYQQEKDGDAADGDAAEAEEAPIEEEEAELEPEPEEELEPEAQGSGPEEDVEAQGDDEDLEDEDDLDAVLAHEEELLRAEEEAAAKPADSDLITDDDLLAEDFGDEDFGADGDGDEDLLF